MIISVTNNLDSVSQYSYTLSNINAGGTVIPVRNTNPFSVSRAIQIGKTAEEQSEVSLLGTAAISGTAINSVGTLKYHPIDTPVYAIKYDQIVFLRSTTGTAGTAVAITGGTKTITPDNIETIFDDTSGLSTYAYQTYFYNSVTLEQSATSSWIVPGGPTQYSLAALRQAVKDDLFDSGFIKSDAQINRWINNWGEQMQNTAIKVNKDYAMSSQLVTFGTSGLGTITTTTFKQVKKMEVAYAGATQFTQTINLPYNQYSESDVFSSVYPRHTWINDNAFIMLPTGQTGTARATFGNVFTPLVNDSDELSSTLRGYTTGCNEYCLYKAYDLDQKTDQAGSHFNLYKDNKNDFINEITPRDQSGPQYMQIEDPISGDDLMIYDIF